MSSINPFGSTDAEIKTAYEANADTNEFSDAEQTKLTGIEAGATAGGGGLVFLSSVTASASATVDLETTFDSTFDSYVIIATDVVAATDTADLTCRLKIGGTYLATATYKFHNQRSTNAATTYQASASSSGTSMQIFDNMGNLSSDSGNFTFHIHGVTGTTLIKNTYWDGSHTDAIDRSLKSSGVGSNLGTAAITGVRFLMSSGNITSGTFRLYGITNS